MRSGTVNPEHDFFNAVQHSQCSVGGPRVPLARAEVALAAGTCRCHLRPALPAPQATKPTLTLTRTEVDDFGNEFKRGDKVVVGEHPYLL